MNLLQRFQEFIQQQKLFQSKDKLLLAVSGGVDSVVLCELCKRSGFDFVIAHCNFQLRGEESVRDEQFVESLGLKYNVDVKVKKFDTEQYALKNRMGIQEAARELRYGWFDEMMVENPKSVPKLRDRNPNVVVTAHHADDNVETVLMNFCRGTGLNGLTGIPLSLGSVRRPLLPFWKDELSEFAKDNNLAFVEDSSNQSSKYTRNLFRNEIIPLIAKAYPQVKANMLDNTDRFREINNLYRAMTGDIKKKLCRHENNELHIPIKQLMLYNSRALIFEIICDFGFTEKQIDEVIKLAESASGKFIQSPQNSYRIIKFRNWFIISSHNSQSAEIFVIEEQMKRLETGDLKVKIENRSHTPDFQIPTSNSIACLDAGEIIFPLVLRKWRPGDYFYPMGMRKKKKLARFFIDQKLSKTEKENAWVLEMDKKIIWVVGMRIDDRFKITDQTKNILKVSLETS